MFYSYHILVRKNSKFSLIWRYMHDKKKVTRGELLSLNVSSACNDLRGYIPTGLLSLSELNNKMSLYLLSQLLYGITMVHDYQVTVLCQNTTEAAKSLLRVAHEEHKRKRKVVHAGGDTIAEEMEGDEENVIPKRKVPKRLPEQAVLDLNDPNSYIADKSARNVSNVAEPLFGADDDMFQVPGEPNAHLEPRLAFEEIQQELARSQDLGLDHGIDVSLKDVKVSVGQYDDWSLDEPIEAARARTLSSQISAREALKNSTLFEDYPQSPLKHPQPPVHVPVYRRELESPDPLVLEPLPDVVKPAEEGLKRRKRRVAYDDVTTLSSSEIANNLKNYADLIRARGRVDLLEAKRIPVNVLLQSRPWHMPYLNEELLELFDLAAVKSQAPLTFEEATRFGAEELRQRYWDNLGLEVETWTSGTSNNTDDRFDECFPTANGPDNVASARLSQADQMVLNTGLEVEDREEPFIVQKISVGFHELTPERAIHEEIERGRFSSYGSHRVSLPQAHYDDFGQFFDDADNVASSLNVTRQRSLYVGDVNELYKEIADAAGSGVCKFADILPANATRSQAARTFYNLLDLLKQKKVKAKQTISYGDIFVRVILQG